MKEIKLTNGMVALVDDADYEWLSRWKWSPLKCWGGQIYALKSVSDEERRMHRLIVSAPKGALVDHINGNTLDNRRSNLRLCTRAENAYNSKAQRGNRVGYKGVCIDGRKRNLSKRYIAQIKVGNKTKLIGRFATAEEAARAYDVAAKELRGDFARLNFE
jgi:hypothetical protein